MIYNDNVENQNLSNNHIKDDVFVIDTYKDMISKLIYNESFSG